MGSNAPHSAGSSLLGDEEDGSGMEWVRRRREERERRRREQEQGKTPSKRQDGDSSDSAQHARSAPEVLAALESENRSQGPILASKSFDRRDQRHTGPTQEMDPFKDGALVAPKDQSVRVHNKIEKRDEDEEREERDDEDGGEDEGGEEDDEEDEEETVRWVPPFE